MEPELITYQKFNDAALANALAVLLSRHNIVNIIVEDSFTNIPAFVDNELSKRFEIKINSDDFEQANQAVAEEESTNINLVEDDYYLFSFSNDELLDLIAKADEWSTFDTLLARKILGERGVALSDEAISTINEKRIEELKAPEPPQTNWIIIGYIVAFLGGILGIFIGWHLSSHKKTLPNGEKVYGYNENDRKQGKRILYLGLVMIVVFTVRAYFNYRY